MKYIIIILLLSFINASIAAQPKILETIMTHGFSSTKIEQIQDPEQNTRLEKIAFNILGIGLPIINNSKKEIFDAIGLPNKMEVRKEAKTWDVDIEHTPVDYIYNGFLITSYFNRAIVDVDYKKAKPILGSYKEGEYFDKLKIFSDKVKLIDGLGVGSKRDNLITLLGSPRTMGRSNQMHYKVSTNDRNQRSLNIIFFLDEEDHVKEITLTIDNWH